MGSSFNKVTLMLMDYEELPANAMNRYNNM